MNTNVPTYTTIRDRSYQNNNEYLMTLIDPANYTCRVPDNLSVSTALYKSRSYYDVDVNNAVTTPTIDLGRFFWAFKPCLGTPLVTQAAALPVANIERWSVLEYAANATWGGANFATSTNYLGYKDPNCDILLIDETWNSNRIVRAIRPVGLSVWFQFTAPQLNIGGNVAIALVPGGGDAEMIFSSVVGAGIPLQDFENLAVLPESYNGKIVDGAYAFWKPLDIVDFQFRDLSALWGATSNMPFIVLAGKISNYTAATINGPVGRIQLDVTYEYTTLSRVVESIPSPIDDLWFRNAKEVISHMNCCMANDSHDGFIRKAIEFSKKLLRVAAPVITTGLGGLIGGPPGAALGGTIGKLISGSGPSINDATTKRNKATIVVQPKVKNSNGNKNRKNAVRRIRTKKKKQK